MKSTRNHARCKALGESSEKLYKIWSNMLLRCKPEYHAAYIYADRDITVCQEWQDYKVFRFWAWLNGYQDGLSLDRIDNDKGYYPNNCRFVTLSGQQRNRRDNLRADDGRLLIELAEDPTIPFNYQQLVYRHRKGTLAAYLKTYKEVQNDATV